MPAPQCQPAFLFSLLGLHISVCLRLIYPVTQNELIYLCRGPSKAVSTTEAEIIKNDTFGGLMEIFLLMACTAPTHTLPLEPSQHWPTNGEIKAPRHTAAK